MIRTLSMVAAVAALTLAANGCSSKNDNATPSGGAGGTGAAGGGGDAAPAADGNPVDVGPDAVILDTAPFPEGGGGEVGPTEGGIDGPFPGAPTIHFTTPAKGSDVVVPDSKKIDVTYKVENYVLMAPGACSGAPACGHAHVTVGADGDSNCNAPGVPYNVAAISIDGSGNGKATIDLSLCKTPVTGSTELRIELVADSHAKLSPRVKSIITVNLK